MTFVGIVPARGGSKRLPRKNILPFNGKPLLAWTAEAALASSLDHVFLSTDATEIAEIGEQNGLAVPFLRPADLANDQVPMLPVLQHLLDWIEAQGIHPTGLVLLQPTSPLRMGWHIDEALRMFEENTAESLVSVTDLPNGCRPGKFMRRHSNNLVEAAGLKDSGDLVLRNGPSIVITRPEVLRQGRLYGDTLLAYHMDRIYSYDIDDQHDFDIAEFVMAQRTPA
jgi:CMP-N-acetylneuraminic acid synthetase